MPRRLVGAPTVAGPAPRRFQPIFRDRTELAVETDLSASLQKALAASAFLIVVCSPDAAKSRWVDEEVRTFQALHRDGRVLAVIVAGRAGGPEADCFPPALRDHGTPIAADLRPGGDGRRLTRLKLIAGMLGVGLDELVRRDAQRRQSQLIAVTAASLVGMTVMGALAGAAMLARDEAVKQRAHAEKERRQADRLIAFMLDDLHKRIEPSGRLDLMDGIARQALAYYDGQDPSDLDATSLERRSSAINLMGAIELQRGDLDQASRAFAAASATTAELLARAPDDGARVFGHAQSVFWVGEVARQQGQTATALVSFRRYLDLALRLPRLDPRNQDWRTEVGNAWSDLGTLYLQLGRVSDALDAFRHSLEVFDAMARASPSDLGRQMLLAQAHAWLADTLEKQGRLAAARIQRQAELSVYRTMLAQDPRFEKAEFSTVVAQESLAELDTIADDTPAALRELAEAAARSEALAAGQRDNMNTAAVAALAQVRLGEALLASGRLWDASNASRSAQGPLSAALAKDISVTSWRNYADEAALLDAAVAARRGALATALRRDSATLGRLEGGARPQLNTYRRWLLDEARLQTAQDHAALGREPEARALWSRIVADLSGEVDRCEPKLLLVLAAADARLGRAAESRIIAQRLATMRRPAKEV